MNQFRFLLIYTVLLSSVYFILNSGVNSNEVVVPDINLVGSTPGDHIIKSLLTIPDTTKVDFIKWNLVLRNTDNHNTFLLNVIFGVSRPNTLDFLNEEQLNFEGTYSINRNKGVKNNGEIYKLTSRQFPNGISIVKLNDNLFHLLSPVNQLINGNGGWSYTLNRKPPVYSAQLPVLTKSLLKDTSQQVIFEGRTPCVEIARDHHLTVTPGCFKIKWKLTLYRDPGTQLPTTYLLQSTYSREKGITGKWSIINGIHSNPDVVLYRLDPDKPEKTLSFLVGDENILYFLNKSNQLYVGNSDFSFTLNRRNPQ